MAGIRCNTDRVDASSLTARVLITLVHISVAQPARTTRGTGAGEGAEDLYTGSVIETRGGVTLGYILLAEIPLEPGRTGTVEG